MKSIKLKLVLIYIILVFIVMIVSGVFMLYSVRASEVSKAKAQLEDFADQINAQVVRGSGSPADFRQAFVDERFSLGQSVSRGIQGCVLDAGKQNKVIAPAEYMELHFSDSSIVAALNGQTGFSVMKKDVNIDNTVREWITCAKPVFDPADASRVTYVIFTRLDATGINESLAGITGTIVWMVVIAMLLTGLMGFMFANTITVPIIRLTKRAKNMAEGNLAQEIPVVGSDEIGQLTLTINYMARELNSHFAAIAGEKNKMEAVLHNMTDGVLAYDSAGRLIHANSASLEMTQFRGLEDITSQEMLERLGLSQEGNVKESTIAVGDRYISAGVTPYMDAEGAVRGIVIVLQDITRHKKLDNMRKEFVANVSHELRTPLTSIKTYTETLLDGAIDEKDVAEDFLRVINSETDRMSLLVQDLLELSRFDNQQLSLSVEIVDLNTIVEQCVKQNDILAVQKSQTIFFTRPQKEYFIDADAGRINQVVTNIISNSVKYSPEGANIEITAEETRKYYYLRIKDNGMGIPKEDLPQIFERFYRVDKARSRAMGGTGLGLSIAREIMEAHNGKITVSSELDKGTVMTLRFNKSRAGDAAGAP